MNRIAEFHKVSFDRFLKDSLSNGLLSDETSISTARQVWEKIQLPRRATTGSAGYDFYSPFSFCLQSGQSINIPTGIRAEMEDGWYLMILPRSGLSFRYGTRLANTASVIDADYYFSDNEGHIFIKMSCSSNFSLLSGDRFAQGIFLPYGITRNDDAVIVRNGGVGSTGMS